MGLADGSPSHRNGNPLFCGIRFMKIKALRQIQKDMKDMPDQVIMSSYFDESLDLLDNPPAGGCGTAACIAGFAIFRAHKAPDLYNASKFNVARIAGCEFDLAKEALGLSTRQGQRLFSEKGWPTKFRKALLHAKTAKAYTAVVIKRIDHFIKTKGMD
jgi:hypothetical protein